MAEESLAGLKDAFAAWRRRKRHAREAVPQDLIERARAAARRYGPAAVDRATKVGRGRLKVDRSQGCAGGPVAATSIMPAYSRIEVTAPAASPPTQPFAEVETPFGLKVRLFTATGEALGLLSVVLGAGGAR